MATPVTMKALLEAGVHFGHQTRRWNPRMQTFMFTKRNGIHIIDLQKTVERLTVACDFVCETVAGGKKILFVGTKKQAQESIELEAKRCSMPYVNNRWLGGTLTNFTTMQDLQPSLPVFDDFNPGSLFQPFLQKAVFAGFGLNVDALCDDNSNFAGFVTPRPVIIAQWHKADGNQQDCNCYALVMVTIRFHRIPGSGV